MKKILLSVCLILGMTLLTACSNETILTCSLNGENTEAGYVLNTSYKVHYQGEIVSKVVATEIITTDDTEILDYFDSYTEEISTIMTENYGGYDSVITKKDNQIMIVTTIDYNVMDLEKLANDDDMIKEAVNDQNQLTVDGVVAMYEELGVTCEGR